MKKDYFVQEVGMEEFLSGMEKTSTSHPLIMIY